MYFNVDCELSCAAAVCTAFLQTCRNFKHRKHKNDV